VSAVSAVSGPELRAARERAGLTRAQIAVETHRSEESVARWELGQTSPPPTVVGTLRRLLELEDRAEDARRLVVRTTSVRGLPEKVADAATLALVAEAMVDTNARQGEDDA
jgi:transcriptional regulator with XRE-family HTH domain